MQRVQHEQHVVNLRETFEDENFVYMVMELCQGGELAAFILEQGNHTESQVALIMRQVLNAVNFLHSCSVCHRDLKPENLLLNRNPIKENVLKVADFGLAAECKTDLQGVVGTLPYMAPQVFAGRYDLAVDMWSCGVLMYLLLCGYPPFWFEFDDKKTEMMIRRGNFAFPQQDWDMISDGARHLSESFSECSHPNEFLQEMLARMLGFWPQEVALCPFLQLWRGCDNSRK